MHHSRRALPAPIRMMTLSWVRTVLRWSASQNPGCVRGGSSEFLLALRHALRIPPKYYPGHPESGSAWHPGGGAPKRLFHSGSVSRSSPLKIILARTDIDGDIGERYGDTSTGAPLPRRASRCIVRQLAAGSPPSIGPPSPPRQRLVQ